MCRILQANNGRQLTLVVLLVGLCLGCRLETLASQPSTPTTPPMPSHQPSQPDSVVQGWAVLAQKENYSDVERLRGQDLSTNFVDISRMRALLIYLGWPENHILELRDNVGQQEIRAALRWLSMHSDANDVVLFYYRGHGSYLRQEVGWDKFFVSDWSEIPSQRRILVVDCCNAAEFTAATGGTSQGYISIAAVAVDEESWTGLWQARLPVLGGVFTHFFVEAFTDPTADRDQDGTVSVQEAAERAATQQRQYLHDVVWTDPRYTPEPGHYDADYPEVVVDDAIGEPLFLELDKYGVAAPMIVGCASYPSVIH
jgi:hypothetical protein